MMSDFFFRAKICEPPSSWRRSRPRRRAPDQMASIQGRIAAIPQWRRISPRLPATRYHSAQLTPVSGEVTRMPRPRPHSRVGRAGDGQGSGPARCPIAVTRIALSYSDGCHCWLGVGWLIALLSRWTKAAVGGRCLSVLRFRSAYPAIETVATAGQRRGRLLAIRARHARYPGGCDGARVGRNYLPFRRGSSKDMYEQFFGLSERPFDRAEPPFIYLSGVTRALSSCIRHLGPRDTLWANRTGRRHHPRGLEAIAQPTAGACTSATPR